MAPSTKTLNSQSSGGSTTSQAALGEQLGDPLAVLLGAPRSRRRGAAPARRGPTARSRPPARSGTSLSLSATATSLSASRSRACSSRHARAGTRRAVGTAAPMRAGDLQHPARPRPGRRPGRRGDLRGRRSPASTPTCWPCRRSTATSPARTAPTSTAVAAEAMGAGEHRFVAAMTGSPGATWVAATGEEQPDAATYGVALLSRHPVRRGRWSSCRCCEAPTPFWFRGQRLPTLVRDEPRVAVAAQVEAPARDDDRGLHPPVLRAVVERPAAALPGRARCAPAERPLVLTGDLNLRPAPGRGPHRDDPGRDLADLPGDAPREQLDHILLDGAARRDRRRAPRTCRCRTTGPWSPTWPGEAQPSLIEPVESPQSSLSVTVAAAAPPRRARRARRESVRASAPSPTTAIEPSRSPQHRHQPHHRPSSPSS